MWLPQSLAAVWAWTSLSWRQAWTPSVSAPADVWQACRCVHVCSLCTLVPGCPLHGAEDEGLNQLGWAGAVELRNAVHAQFGVELPATVTFDYPTIAAMADFLAARLAPPGPPPGPAAALPSPAVLPVADSAGGGVTEVVGLSSVMSTPGTPDCGAPRSIPLGLPGWLVQATLLPTDCAGILPASIWLRASGSPQEPAAVQCQLGQVDAGPDCWGHAGFATPLMGCLDVNRRIPLERWDVNTIPAPDDVLASNMLRFACFMDQVDRFDSGVFRLARAEAAALDPQSRVLLQQTFASLQVRPLGEALWQGICQAGLRAGAVQAGMWLA